MTVRDRADLAVLQDQMHRANKDISEIKDDVKSVLIKFEDLDKRYITRSEYNVLRSVIYGFIVIAGVIGTYLVAWYSRLHK